MTDPHELTTISVTLRKLVVEQTDELAYATGTTRDALIERAMAGQYRDRAFMARDECPWTITVRAMRDYLAILGRPETPDNLDEARDVLEAAAVDATRAEQEGRRQPQRIGSGAYRYRGPKPHRLTLVVNPPSGGATSPQLVAVTSSGRRR